LWCRYQKRRSRGVSRFWPCNFVVGGSMGKSRRARALFDRCKKAASGPSFLSTPIDAFRKIPGLFNTVNRFNSWRWWAHQESNLELILRRDWLYPFNYRPGDDFVRDYIRNPMCQQHRPHWQRLHRDCINTRFRLYCRHCALAQRPLGRSYPGPAHQHGPTP
jgi:hypothetical protein